MKRLLGFVRPYWAALLGSVVLMAMVGAAQASLALLIRPIFDRVLNPTSPESPVMVFNIDQLGIQIDLNRLFPIFVPAAR